MYKGEEERGIVFFFKNPWPYLGVAYIFKLCIWKAKAGKSLWWRPACHLKLQWEPISKQQLNQNPHKPLVLSLLMPALHFLGSGQVWFFGIPCSQDFKQYINHYTRTTKHSTRSGLTYSLGNEPTASWRVRGGTLPATSCPWLVVLRYLLLCLLLLNEMGVG